MKLLFFNINGENIQSTENITVVGKPEDAIINKFYFELVKGIVKGVTVSGIGDVKKRGLVTDFEANNKEAFAKITEQWELVKQVLLGEDPSGTRTITLPEEYINWLKYHGNPIYNEIAKSLASRGSVVEIGIEKIYTNAIGLLVNNIDLSNKYDSFTVNDEIVDDDSAVSVDIRKKIGENVPFVAFEDWKYPIEDKQKGKGNITVKKNNNDGAIKEERLIIAQKKDDYKTVGITVYDGENKPIYNKSGRWGLDIRWARPSEELPLKLYVGVEYGYNEMDAIGFDGKIEQVDEDDLPWFKRSDYDLFDKDSFLQKHPEYFDCDLPSDQNENGDFIIEGLKGKPRTDYHVDVWTSSGQLLCTLPSMTFIAEVLPSGLYVISRLIDKDYFAYGIADKYGKVLLPCKYGKHHRNQVGDQPFREEGAEGIIYCDEFCEETGNYDESRRYKDVFNGDFYFQVTKDFLVKRTDARGFDGYNLTIMDVESRRTLHRFKQEIENGLEEIKEGWYRLPIYYEDENYDMLISRYSAIKLQPIDGDAVWVYNYYSSNGYCGDGSDDLFISEDRIIAFEAINEADGVGHFKRIMIYSYEGELIKEYSFKKTPLLIKSPYKYGKALCLRINGKSSSLCYLDLDGNEHQIPNKVGMKIRDYSKTELFMASENTFVINTKNEDEDGFRDYCGKLMSLDGDVLFSEAWWIKPLADGFLSYASGKGDGIIDAKGKMAISPKREFDDFEVVIHSGEKYKKYQKYGNGKYEEL